MNNRILERDGTVDGRRLQLCGGQCSASEEEKPWDRLRFQERIDIVPSFNTFTVAFAATSRKT